MDSQASDPASKKGRLMPLSEHPQMDRLADILETLPQDRQKAFNEWLEEADASEKDGMTHGDSQEE
jgi:hypothetical protein